MPVDEDPPRTQLPGEKRDQRESSGPDSGNNPEPAPRQSQRTSRNQARCDAETPEVPGETRGEVDLGRQKPLDPALVWPGRRLSPEDA